MTKTIIYTVSCEESYAVQFPSNDIVHVYVPMNQAFIDLDDAMAFVEAESDSRNLVTSGGFRLSERKPHEGWTPAYGDDETLSMTATLSWRHAKAQAVFVVRVLSHPRRRAQVARGSGAHPSLALAGDPARLRANFFYGDLVNFCKSA